MTQPEQSACGFIVAYVEQGRVRYLLLRSAYHRTWGAPKGHSEPGESGLETALRETREETGITKLNRVEGFERRFSYTADSPSGSYLKHVTYWLATVPKPEHTISAEHDDSAWCELEGALERLQFDQIKQVFREADEFLRNHVS